MAIVNFLKDFWDYLNEAMAATWAWLAWQTHEHLLLVILICLLAGISLCWGLPRP